MAPMLPPAMPATTPTNWCHWRRNRSSVTVTLMIKGYLSTSRGAPMRYTAWPCCEKRGADVSSTSWLFFISSMTV